MNKDKHLILVIILFGFTIWWLFIKYFDLQETTQNYLFAATYGVVALIGGVWGILAAKKWGGLRSSLGKGLLYLSFGLLLQEFGQIVFSYYNIVLHKEIPYPSLADVGFFGSVLFYIVGLIYFVKVSGAEQRLKKNSQRLGAVIFPLCLLSLSYFMFLQNYEFDFTTPLRTFLDFSYPFGQALYLSFAILLYSYSRSVLGGIMRKPILAVFFALLLQYVAEFNFLYQNINGTWINGRYGDYLYFVSYVAMSFAIVSFESAYNLIRVKDKSEAI